MDYHFKGELTEEQTKLMKSWLAECWLKLDEEEAADDFLVYILLLINKQYTMQMIQSELTDLEVDTVKSSRFVTMIGTKLQEIANISEKIPEIKSDSKIISIVSTSTASESNKLLGPLKSSRGSSNITSQNLTSSNEKTGSSRLLSSALKSTRDVIDNKSKQKDTQMASNNNIAIQLPTSRDPSNNKNTNHRNIQLVGQKRDSQEVNYDINNKKKNKTNQNIRTIDNSSTSQAQSGGIPVGSVEYFEKMNQVAQQSGFKNAQEMIASQKEMLALLQPPPQQSFPPSVAVTGNATYPQQIHAGSVVNNMSSPYQHFNQSYMERGGRGRGGRWLEGRVGRGRGRGGRFPTTVDPSADTTTATVPTIIENSSVEPQVAASSIPVTSTDLNEITPATSYHPGATTFHSGGRGGRIQNYWYERGGGRGAATLFAGRSSGRFSRAPISGDKTWVRPTDLETPLSNTR